MMSSPVPGTSPHVQLGQSVPGLSPNHQIPNDVVARLLLGPLVLNGRNSGTSTKSREAAVQDLREGAQGLARMGLDVESALPDDAELLEMLAKAEAHTAIDTSGRKFSNRYVVLDLRAEHNLVVLLSAGTASKVRAEDGVQPFAEKLAQVVWSYQAPVVFGKRVDRWTRNAWQLARMAAHVEELDGMVGDTVHGFRRVDGVEAIMLFFHAVQAQETAASLPSNSRRGMSSRTATRMVAGRALMATSHPVPPGLGTARLLDGNGRSAGRLLLYIDGVGCQPQPCEVAYGLPQITGSDGDPVDQVANVRWVLSVLGRKEWPMPRIAAHLAAAQFSHVGLRRQKGGDATYELPQSPADARHLKRPFLNNLEFYRTGRLVLRLGVEDVEDLAIDGCFPPDGPWMTDADYNRIIAWANKRPPRAGAMLFSGVSAVLNGREEVALSSGTADISKRLRRHEHYLLVHASTYQRGGRTIPQDAEPIPHGAFAESIASAIGRAGHDALPLAPPEGDHDTELARVKNELHRANKTIERLRRESQGLLLRLTDVVDGAPLLTGRAAVDVQTHYNDVTERKLPQAEADQVRLAQQLAHLQQPRVRESDVASLLRLVAALRDPVDVTTRHVWWDVIRDLKITTSRTKPFLNMMRRVVSWSGCLEFTIPDGNAIRIPFAGSVQDGAAVLAEERVDEAVAHVRRGVPIDQVPVPQRDGLRSRIAARLAASLDIEVARARTLLMIDDARCLQAHLGVLDPKSSPTGVPDPDLIERARAAIHRAPRRGNSWAWRVAVRRDAHHMYLWAASAQGQLATRACPAEIGNFQHTRSWLQASHAASDWDFSTRGLVRLHPCRHCGGYSRGLMTLLEPDTSVCLECRLDRSDNEWPADPYDRYLAGLEDYIKAGLILSAPPPPPVVTASQRRELRRPESFTKVTREQILAEYAEDRIPVVGSDGLAAKHGITPTEIYRLVNAAGVELRQDVRQRRRDAWWTLAPR